MRGPGSELNIWNDNIQSFRPETSEALVLVFHAVRTSVSVPRMQTVRGPYVSFSPLLGPLHGQYKHRRPKNVGKFCALQARAAAYCLHI